MLDCYVQRVQFRRKGRSACLEQSLGLEFVVLASRLSCHKAQRSFLIEIRLIDYATSIVYHVEVGFKHFNLLNCVENRPWSPSFVLADEDVRVSLVLEQELHANLVVHVLQSSELPSVGESVQGEILALKLRVQANDQRRLAVVDERQLLLDVRPVGLCSCLKQPLNDLVETQTACELQRTLFPYSVVLVLS